MTEGLHDMVDHSNENDFQNSDSTGEVKTSSETTKGALSKRQIAKWIPLDKIDFDDKTYHIRETDDPETIERYGAVWKNALGDRPIAKGTKSPFPEVLVTEREDGVLIPVDGWHRMGGAKTAGLSMVYGKIVSGTRDELLKLALQANGNNGLPMKKSDLRHCIQKVQRLHPEWNPAAVVEFIGRGSPSYAAQIEKEQSQISDTTIPQTRIGKDGKTYPVAKKSRKKKCSSKTGARKSTAKTEKAITSVARTTRLAKDSKANREALTLISISDFFRGKSVEEFLSLVLDSCEKRLDSDTEKDILYIIIIRWLGQRVDLSACLNNNP